MHPLGSRGAPKVPGCTLTNSCMPIMHLYAPLSNMFVLLLSCVCPLEIHACPSRSYMHPLRTHACSPSSYLRPSKYVCSSSNSYAPLPLGCSGNLHPAIHCGSHVATTMNQVTLVLSCPKVNMVLIHSGRITLIK